MRPLKWWLMPLVSSVLTIVFAAAAGPTVEHGFDLSNLDRTSQPCTDFNRFANGGWMARNPIPPAYPRWGTFNALAEKNREVLRGILDEAAKDPGAPHGSNRQKVGDFYASCMDAERIESEGARPLAPEFDRIAAIDDLPSFEAEILRLQGYGLHAPFLVGSTQDFKNSSQVIGEIDQKGLGMPDRDYYTRTDEKANQIRDQYVKHIGKMFELLGDDPASAAAEAKTVMSLETRLAEASMTREARRDPSAVYHKMGLTLLRALAPDFPWQAYFSAAGLEGKGEINVAAPDFFKELNRELTIVPLREWKNYLRWHVINAAAPNLSSKFVDEDFNFNGRVLTGAQENLPRWRRCVGYTDSALGEALGQLYVQKTFTPDAKARALSMVRNVEAALRGDLSTLSWMGEATRKQALAKLGAVVNKIGYPDKWRDYSALEIDPGTFLLNVVRANAFEFRRDLGKVGKPVDRTEWGMTPPTVNAYYQPTMNEIVFPAGILQPPYYDPNADDALNYGGMGAVIGHEITHGFDDQGRKFDAQGNLANWWSADDLKNFEARAACVVTQFDGYEAAPNLHENGKLVVGESIADLGGLTLAYRAFEKSLEGKPRPQNVDGFSPEQRFFLAWARMWAENTRPEFERLIVTTNPHPLPRFRVNGPVSNLPAFQRAFSCQPSDPLVRPPTERCVIW
jgi:putative endopeptidase